MTDENTEATENAENTDVGEQKPDAASEVDTFFEEDTEPTDTPTTEADEFASDVGTSGPSDVSDDTSAEVDEEVDEEADAVDADAHDDEEPAFTPELLKQAADVLGLPEATAKAFPNAESLIAAITHTSAAAQLTGEAGEASRNGKDAKADEKAADTAKPVTESLELDWDAIKDEVGEEAAGVMKKITDRADAMVTQISTRMAQFEEADLRRQTADILTEYDAHFDRLDKPDLFGTGATAEMDGTTKEFENRLKFLKFAEPFSINMKRHHGNKVSGDAIVDHAFRALYPDQETSTVVKDVKDSLRKRAANTVPRSGKKNSQAEPGRDAALAEMEEIMAKGGS